MSVKTGLIGLGIFCSTHDNRLTTNRVIRLNKLNKTNVMNIFDKNLRDFIELLKFSCSMGLTIFRLGSNFIPFASHNKFNRDWFEEIEYKLKNITSIVKDLGIRITMHPAQFVVLNSKHQNIVEQSLKELEYHFWVLDSLGIGSEGVVVIHVGGVYGDKKESLKRFKNVIENNQWLKKRLAVENDEKFYTVAEVIEIAEDIGIPVVFDYYHHILNPSNFDIDRLISTWKGITPEVHISSKSSSSRRFGEHGDYVDLKDFTSFLSLWNNREADIIVEAKKKELAVEKLVKEIKSLGIELRFPPCKTTQ